MAAILVLWPTVHQLNKFCPPIIKAPNLIWLWSVQQLETRLCMTMDKGQTMILTSGPHRYSSTHLVNYLYPVLVHTIQQFLLNFKLKQYKSIRKQCCWPCHKVSPGKPKIIIWTNFVGPESPVLYTMFEGLLLSEKKILKGFIIYGHSGHLGHMTWIIWINFCSPISLMLHMEFGFDWANSSRGTFSFKCLKCGHGAILVIWPKPLEHIFFLPTH